MPKITGIVIHHKDGGLSLNDNVALHIQNIIKLIKKVDTVWSVIALKSTRSFLLSISPLYSFHLKSQHFIGVLIKRVLTFGYR
jgi:hypothetical protein